MPRQKKAARRKKVLPGSTGLAPKEILTSAGKQSQEAASAVQASGVLCWHPTGIRSAGMI